MLSRHPQRLRQVRFLRKLMPGKGFYTDVLCYLLKAWKRCAVPAAIAGGNARHGAGTVDDERAGPRSLEN